MPSRRVPVASTGFIEPCLPSAASEPPSGPDWLHEVKFDGYRARTVPACGYSRGCDLTERFPAIVNAARALPKSFLIDGEAVYCDESGVPVFQMLRQGATRRACFSMLSTYWR